MSSNQNMNNTELFNTIKDLLYGISVGQIMDFDSTNNINNYETIKELLIKYPNTLTNDQREQLCDIYNFIFNDIHIINPDDNYPMIKLLNGKID